MKKFIFGWRFSLLDLILITLVYKMIEIWESNGIGAILLIFLAVLISAILETIFAKDLNKGVGK